MRAVASVTVQLSPGQPAIPIAGRMTMTATIATRRSTAAAKPAVWAATGLALAGIVIVAGNYHVSKGENGGTGPAISTAVLCAVLAGALFGIVVPRVRRLERTTLILGIISVISLVIFWSGVTPIIAAAAGAVSSRGAEATKATKTGQVLGVAASLLAVGWTLANSHLF